MMKCVEDEIEIMETTKHPFLINMKAAFKTDERIFLVMPFIDGGEMFTHLSNVYDRDGHGFPETTARWFIA